MRHETFLIAGAAAALMATACDKVSSITGPEVADARPKFAIGSIINEWDMAWTIDEPNPCITTIPVEVVATTGSTHLVLYDRFDNSYGVHHSLSMSSHGSGVGAPSLVPYKISDQNTESDQDPEGPQATELMEEQLLVNAAKSELNYIRHTVIKVTFNAAGIPTATVDNTFTKCAGQPIDATI